MRRNINRFIGRRDAKQHFSQTCRNNAAALKPLTAKTSRKWTYHQQIPKRKANQQLNIKRQSDGRTGTTKEKSRQTLRIALPEHAYCCALFKYGFRALSMLLNAWRSEVRR